MRFIHVKWILFVIDSYVDYVIIIGIRWSWFLYLWCPAHVSYLYVFLIERYLCFMVHVYGVALVFLSFVSVLYCLECTLWRGSILAYVKFIELFEDKYKSWIWIWNCPQLDFSSDFLWRMTRDVFLVGQKYLFSPRHLVECVLSHWMLADYTS